MEEKYNPAKGSGEQEMTLRDIILLFREYALEIWRKKWWIALCCLPFIGWKAYEYSKSHVTYPATLTFMIDDGKNGSALNLGGILSTLGGDETVKEYDKIVALSKSMTIVKDVMLSRALLDGKEDYLGNHLIRVEKVEEEIWSKKTNKKENASLSGFLFTRDSFAKFTRMEYSAMKTLRALINGNEEIDPIFSISYNEASGILTYKVECRSEEMSVLLLNTFFEKLSKFYVEKSVGKNYITYEIIKYKVDSIRRALNNLEMRQAQFEDASHSVLLNADRIPTQRYAREKQMLTLMYGEATKNLELADFAMKSSAPYIQIVDHPIPPILEKPVSRLRLLISALLFGIATGVTIVVSRKLLIDSFYA